MLVNGIVQKDTITGAIRGVFGSEGVASIASSSGDANTALSNLASVAINTSLLLGTSDGGALGSTTKMWSDLFLASGAVINFNNGNVTLTHSVGLLTFSSSTDITGGGGLWTLDNDGTFYGTAVEVGGNYTGNAGVFQNVNASGRGVSVQGGALAASADHSLLLTSYANAAIAAFYSDIITFSVPLTANVTGTVGATTPTTGVFTTAKVWDGVDAGFFIRPYTAGGAIGAIYPASVTPNDTNFTLVGSSNLAQLNGAGAVNLSIANVNKLEITSTGATFTNGLVVGGNLALGTNSLTMTGSIGATGARVTKGWFTDLQVTNGIIIGGAITGATTLAISGGITSTLGNNTVIFTNTTATTGYQLWAHSSGNAGTAWGFEAATAAGLYTGALNNASFFGATANAPLQLFTNGISRIDIAAAGGVTIKSLAGTGTRTVVADANGVLSAP